MTALQSLYQQCPLAFRDYLGLSVLDPEESSIGKGGLQTIQRCSALCCDGHMAVIISGHM
jgi:hypothetical protein